MDHFAIKDREYFLRLAFRTRSSWRGQAAASTRGVASWVGGPAERSSPAASLPPFDPSDASAFLFTTFVRA